MIRINVDKAKTVAHNIRRAARAEEFAPHDKAIAAQIPGTDQVAIEAARQEIRDKYAAMQTAIDAATTAEQIKEALS